MCWVPGGQCLVWRALRLTLQRPQVRLRGYQPLFGVNYHCLSRYVPLHLNGLMCLMHSGGWKQRANVYQRPRSDFLNALLLAETLGFRSRTALGVSVWRWGVRGSQWGVEVLNPVILLLPVTLARCSTETAKHYHLFRRSVNFNVGCSCCTLKQIRGRVLFKFCSWAHTAQVDPPVVCCHTHILRTTAAPHSLNASLALPGWASITAHS